MIGFREMRVRIQDLEAELRSADQVIDVLKGALAAETVEAIGVPRWAEGLPQQCCAIMGALIARYPRYIKRENILSCIPDQGYDDTIDRDPNQVSVQVCRIRRALGADAIENWRGNGYRVSPAFMARIGGQLC